MIELIVGVSIVALLLALASPSYQRQRRNTLRSVGRAELAQVRMRQEQYFLDHKQYAAALTELDYPSSPYAIDAAGNVIAALSSDRIYLIDLVLRDDDYMVSAAPQLAQMADRMCGTLSVDSMGIRLVTGEAAVRDCW